MREIKVSPDGNAVAIRSDWADDAWNAWAVMHAVNGGHWAASSEVEGWQVVSTPDTPSEPTE